MSHTALWTPQVPASAPDALAHARARRRARRQEARRISRVGRLAMALMTLAMLAAAIAPALAGPSPDIHESTTTVRVVAGDSLWSIAEAATPQGASVGETVDAILCLNGLDDPALAPGVVLSVPTPESGRLASR